MSAVRSWSRPPSGREAKDAAGWLAYRKLFVATGAARGVLLGFGTDVEVLAPTSLRQHFAETAAAIVSLYAG